MRTKYEVADVIDRFGDQFIQQYNPNTYHRRVLHALSVCRTASLGGHIEECDSCKKTRNSYNSCGNRHCPKCQAAKQAFWTEGLLCRTLPVKHYHLVFTVPHLLNQICLLNSKWFYNQLFASVWDIIQTFGYTRHGALSGAVCVLHTWGQNLSFHNHLHCLVPAVGLNLKGNLIHIGHSETFLYPVQQISAAFKRSFTNKIESFLDQTGNYQQYTKVVKAVKKLNWVVFCEPSLGKPQHVIKYLGQYSHRVAIANNRILDISDSSVAFLHKDYRDNALKKPVTLTGVEFLRRFTMHILPKGLVKIRYFGIYAARCLKKLKQLNIPNTNKQTEKPKDETPIQRLKRLTGFDPCICPFCKSGNMIRVDVIPRARSPGDKHLLLLKYNQL